jgi:hypothetical protein
LDEEQIDNDECKTDRKPYDLVVCAVLLRAKHLPTTRLPAMFDCRIRTSRNRGSAKAAKNMPISMPLSKLAKGSNSSIVDIESYMYRAEGKRKDKLKNSKA